MVAVGGPQAGSAWGKRDPGEMRQARDHQQGSRRGSHRPPTAPDAGTPLRGPGLRPPAPRRTPRPRAASPALALALPRLKAKAKAARLLGRPARPQGEASPPPEDLLPPELPLFKRPGSRRGSRRAPLPPSNQARRPSAGGKAGGQRVIETRAVADRTPLRPLRLLPFYAMFQSPREKTSPLPHSAPC